MYVPWGAQVSNAYDAVALGAGSQTSVNGGVALGAGAVASRDTSDLKSLPYDAAYANGGAIHTRKYNSPARTSGATQSAVSVGNDNDKRQIINVAGGSDDYDAVNVAQLKNVGVIVKGNTGKSDFLVHDGSLKVEGTGRISNVAADDGTKDSKITLSFDDSGLANTSLTNITNDGKKTITGLGTIVKAGDNVTVTSTSDATTGQKTYTVSTTSPVVYTDKDGNKVYLHDDGKFYTSATGGTEVNNSNVIASFKDPSGATTGGTMIVNNVGSAISNHTTPGVTSPTYLDKLDAAAGDTKTQNAAVNVTDLKNTADGLTEKGLKFDANSGGVKTNKLGSTVKVQGEGAKADTEYSGKNVKTIINQDSVGNTTIDVKLDKNLETDTITATGKDGKDGKIGINGHDGVTTTITVTRDGKPGVDGAPGTTTTRVVYEKPDGSKEEVATLDDGMKFAGDDGQTDSSKVISKKLNTVVDIVGGADKTKLTDNNIGVNNVNGKLKVQLSKDLDLTAGGSVKMGDTTVNNGGITIKAPTGGTTTDVHLGSDGLNNGGNKITNVAKGTADTDAVNVSQLKDAKSELKADERHIKPGTYTVDSNGKVTMTYVDGNGHDVANEKAVIEGIAKNDLSNITNDGKNVITNLIDMENGNNTTVSSRKDATGKKIFKVDVDLSATNRKVDTAATGTGSVASGSAAGAAVVNKGTQFVAGDNMVVKRETMSGNDTDQKITYALNPNLQNIKSISSSTTTSNAPRIDFGSNTVTINNGNLSLGGNKITNLAPGTSSTDAVNLSQLEGARTKVTSNDGSVTVTRNENTTTKEITYDLHVAGGNGTPDPTIYNRINKLGDEIETVGALGAALGALKPIQYDPLEPTQIMAGYGNYRGTSALALGVAHYRNESLMMHAGMSWAGGSSHMMANAGVTWKLGHRDPETAIADRYRRGPISSAYALQQEMAAVKEENQGLKGEVADLKSENAEMKKNIAMLMAKLGM